MRHFATWTGESFAVVRLGPTGGATIVTEGCTLEAMEREAEKLNAEQTAREALAEARALSARIRATQGPRLGVRYFEPEAFA
jgi:hypothetical protein